MKEILDFCMATHKNYYTVRTYASRCFRVENEIHIDLDCQYQNDKLYKLMQKLKYSRNLSCGKIIVSILIVCESIFILIYLLLEVHA